MPKKEQPVIIKERRSVGVERHIQTLLVSGVGALILWVGVTVMNTSATIGIIAEQLKNLQQQIADMKATLATQGSGFTKELETNRNILSNHEARLMMLESKK